MSDPIICDCEGCRLEREGLSSEEAIARIKARDAERIGQFGWIVHYVTGDPAMPYHVNIHTHGLPDSYGHPDLQLVAPLAMDIVQSIFRNIIERIVKGDRFQPGVVYDQILGNGYSCTFAEATECNRAVLRVILPDAQNRLGGDADRSFVSQRDGTVSPRGSKATPITN